MRCGTGKPGNFPDILLLSVLKCDFERTSSVRRLANLHLRQHKLRALLHPLRPLSAAVPPSWSRRGARFGSVRRGAEHRGWRHGRRSGLQPRYADQTAPTPQRVRPATLRIGDPVGTFLPHHLRHGLSTRLPRSEGHPGLLRASRVRECPADREDYRRTWIETTGRHPSLEISRFHRHKPTGPLRSTVSVHPLQGQLIFCCCSAVVRSLF